MGCGTGKNLLHLGRIFPEARLWGLDLSPHMLAQARKKLRGLGHRVTLVQAAYDRPVAPGQFDLVVFSYALSMFNPGWEAALRTASQDLSPGGAIAVVDFHDSPSKRFKRWMGFNHALCYQPKNINFHLVSSISFRVSWRGVTQTTILARSSLQTSRKARRRINVPQGAA